MASLPAVPSLLAFAVTVSRLCLWLALLAAVFVPLEQLFAARAGKVFRRGFLDDLGFYFVSSLVPGLVLGLPLSLLAWGAHRFVPSAFADAVAHWPVGARLAASLVVGEVGFYWGHRWSHEIPLLWRFHAVHHSAEHMHWLVNTRAHPVDMVFTRLCGLVPLYVLGLASPLGGGGGVLVPAAVLLFGTVWGFFVHANLRWRFGPLERLVATPAFHHWHHANDGPDVVDKNYAAMLPVIDQLFGTFHLPGNERPGSYGIDEAMPSGLAGHLLHPFQARRPGHGAGAHEIPDGQPAVTTA